MSGCFVVLGARKQAVQTIPLYLSLNLPGKTSKPLVPFGYLKLSSSLKSEQAYYYKPGILSDGRNDLASQFTFSVKISSLTVETPAPPKTKALSD
jgi:hypothetical protein